MTSDAKEKQAQRSAKTKSLPEDEDRRGKMNWAMRLKRVFNIEITVCRHCQGPVRIIACIRVEAINPNYEAGFNLGAHYVFQNSGTHLQLNWSHLQTTDTDSVSVNPASQWVSPFSQTGTPPTKNGDITGISLKSD